MELVDALRAILFLATLISLETWSNTSAGCHRLRKCASHQRAFTAIEVLGLQPGASKADVRSAFRRLAKKYHPDVADTGDAAKFQAILQAANELSSQPDVIRDEFDELFDDLVDMEAVTMEGQATGGDLFTEWVRLRSSRNQQQEDSSMLDSLTQEEVVGRVGAILALFFGSPAASVSSETTLVELGFFKEYDYDVSDVLMALELEFDIDLVEISTEHKHIRFDLPLEVQTIGEFAEFLQSKKTY